MPLFTPRKKPSPYDQIKQPFSLSLPSVYSPTVSKATYPNQSKAQPINQSVASTRNPNMSVAPKVQPKPTPKPSWQDSYFQKNPVANFGRNLAQGKGVSTVQRVIAPSAQKNMSVAPKPQGSSSNYSSSNQPYAIASTADGGVKYSDGSVRYPNGRSSNAPSATSQSQPQQQPQTDPYKSVSERNSKLIDDYVSGQTDILDYRRRLAEEGAQDYQDYLDASFGLQRDELLATKGDLMNEYDQFKKESEAGIEDLRASGTRQKEQNELTTGEALRKGAQLKRQTDAQRQNMFAALGTIDSGGAMGFTGQQINADSDFTRDQQKLLQMKKAKDDEIDSQVATAERKAVSEIQNEGRKLQTALRQINSTMAQGSIEHQQATREAYRQYQTTVFDIADQIMGLKANAEQQKLAFEQSLIAIQAENMPFTPSDEFIKTGVPTNAEEWMYRNKNADAWTKLYPQFGSGKQLDASQVATLYDYDNSIQQMNGLRSLIGQYSGKFGPIQGQSVRNPYDTDAQAVQSQIKAVAQMVGKAMEGGVLRAEDVPKYENMLPKMTDTAEVAQRKIENVIALLEQQRNIRRQGFQQSGYSVGEGMPTMSTLFSGNSGDPLGIGF